MNKILVVDDVPGWVRFHENNINALMLENLIIDHAFSAREGLNKIEPAIDSPYDVIFTDMQMESDFLPKLAGEWFIEQIQMFKEYKNTKIVIVSAAPDIARIAKKYGVLYAPKHTIRNADSSYYKQFID